MGSLLSTVNLFWFRRDLRLHDNAGLYHALKAGRPVIPIFIFDKNILDKLEDRDDRRVEFIHQAVLAMQKELIELGSSLEVFYGFPEDVFQLLLKKYPVGNVYTNHDYEPYAIRRDKSISDLLDQHHAGFHSFKDQVIFEKDEVVKDDGKPYTVFTPYSKKWKAKLNAFYLTSYPSEKYQQYFHKQEPVAVPELADMGFERSGGSYPDKHLKQEIIRHYTEDRDYPGRNGTSRLGVHLRFGTVSIRELASSALTLNETFLNELIWRDFYQMILWFFPQVGEGKAFKREYDLIRWRNNEEEFEKWCRGQTGYPIVDAGMRELNATGYMHNRVRMITASFLAKHLLIDWRWGEAYFARKLLDFDFAANNGGWQWAAGSGCDAAPYFRIFNPALQTEKFDRDLRYIRQWVPEFQEFSYPVPIVQHEFARKRCLDVYSEVLKQKAV